MKTGEEKGDFFFLLFLKQYISAGMGGELSENLNLLVMQRESWQLEKGRKGVKSEQIQLSGR